MALNIQTRPTRDLDGPQADSSPPGYKPTLKPQIEIPESQPLGTELGISANHRAVLDGHDSPEGKIEYPSGPRLQENLQKHEGLTEKQQARDLKIKTRVRMVKILLRGVNFACSLIVVTMAATALHIFFATRHLPTENNLPPWATGTQTWPQYVLLAISCVALALCLMIFYSYWKCGHRGAEKMAVYHTICAAGVFIFNVVMWGIAAGILQGSRDRNRNQDIWGWSCAASNWRKHLNEKIDYALVCKLQSWSLICCIIEVVVESITFGIYGVIFYRYYSKRQLRKAMDARDQALSDLYSAELPPHSDAPVFELLSRPYSSYLNSPHAPPAVYTTHPDPNECLSPGTYFLENEVTSQPPKPFMFQSPPTQAYVAIPGDPQAGVMFPPTHHGSDRVEHATVAWDEQIYGAVPIPAAYADSLRPLAPQQIFGSLAWHSQP